MYVYLCVCEEGHVYVNVLYMYMARVCMAKERRRRQGRRGGGVEKAGRRRERKEEEENE